MSWLTRSAFAAASCAVALELLPTAQAAPATGHSSIAWQVASTEADVDRAFALARQQGKPLFFYWGAIWCPPCNQVKATLFSRPEFIERSHTFVPVYVDGDRPGAQKVAARFRVTGYPTMVLFRADGAEITRLPGEVDPERYLLALSAGLDSRVSVKELAARAIQLRPLSAQEWRLLVFYSWDTDEQQVFKAADLPSSLARLAAAAPAGSLHDRLALKSAVARAQVDPPSSDEPTRAVDRALVERVLRSPSAVTEQRDLLVLYADTLLKYLSQDGRARAELAKEWEASLSGLKKNSALSRIDLLDVVDAQIDLWKAVDRAAELAPFRRDAVRSEALHIVALTTDKYERQAVVPSAAHVLASAGLLIDSDNLLKSELPRAVSPYYHMLALASNAKSRGDKQDALRWYEMAWRKAEGPATRLQWGASYVRELTVLAPAEVSRIASAASMIISELEPKGETFYERNQRSLRKMADYLLKWEGSDPGRKEVVSEVRRGLREKCLSLSQRDPGRSNCEGVFARSSKVGA